MHRYVMLIAQTTLTVTLSMRQASADDVLRARRIFYFATNLYLSLFAFFVVDLL